MKKPYIYSIAAGVLLLGFSGCSSSNTETTTTTTTTEPVTTETTDNTTTRTSEMDTGTGPGQGVWSATPATTKDTTSFHAIAASNDMLEIHTGNQAQAKATHPEVKSFAAQMIADHTKTTEELKGIASRKNLEMPDGVLPAHQRMIVKLSREEDADEYDEEYMEMQVLAHRQAVELFERASKNETDPELKAFAARHLPHLKMHLETAKKTKDLVD